MLKLYKTVYNLINPICNAYADHYPIDLEQEDGQKNYPYAEFTFPNSVPNNTYSELNTLQIDIWDNKSGDVTDIETIADNIDKALNRLKINDDEKYVQFYRNSPYRLKLDDPDINIQRRELRYILKTYYK